MEHQPCCPTGLQQLGARTLSTAGAIEGLAFLLPLAFFSIAVMRRSRPLMWIALAACPIWLGLQIFTWWPPYIFGASANWARVYARAFAQSTQILPRWGKPSAAGRHASRPADSPHRISHQRLAGNSARNVIFLTSGGHMPTKKRAPASDAITLLKKDHEKVRGLLKKLETAALRGDGRADDLLQKIDREVKIHSQVEEEIFYPAFHEAARTKEENKLFFEAKEEHHVVDMVMPEVSEFDQGNADFAGRAKVLKDLIEHHADEEEKQMFPAAKKLLGRDELRELGRRIEARKRELKAE